MDRRSFIRGGIATASLLGLPAGTGWSMGSGSLFRMVRLRFGLEADPRQGACSRLLWELEKRTSVAPDLEVRDIEADDPYLFSCPMALVTGVGDFPMPDEEVLEKLRRYLAVGGFIFADSCGSPPGSGFDAAFRRLVDRLVPGRKLKPLSGQHVLYQSFYLLSRPYGRVINKPFLEGVTHDERTAMVYSQNDIPGAWARDPFGRWTHPVQPGGDRQRELAFRMGVNLVMYVLCLTYKTDQVHIPFILKKRKWRSRPGEIP